MRKVQYSTTGGPEVLKLVDADVPEPGPGEVRVRIHRSGVNPTDWKSRRGSAAGVPVEPAQTPNQDGSGVVDTVGEGVDAALSGRRVWVWESAHRSPYGTAAEFAVVPERQVVPLADTVSFDLGAALGVPFVTAHRCLTVHEAGPRRLDPGALSDRHVLVAGGAGAVGNAAIQLARWADATVLTTVSSPQKAQLAAAAGADHIIDYRQQDVVVEARKIVPAGVDMVIEVAAAQNAQIDAHVLAQGGSVAVYAGTGNDQVALPIRPMMVLNARWQFVLLYDVSPAAKDQAVHDVTAAVVAGAVHTGEQAGLPLHHYGLEDTAAAHTAVEQGAVGKVLIDVAG
jgi:NADPH2:quinone reductase